MSNIQQVEGEVIEALDELQVDIHRVKKSGDPIKAIREANRLAQRAKTSLDLFAMETRNVPEEQWNAYQVRLQEHRDNLKQLVTELMWKRTEIQKETKEKELKAEKKDFEKKKKELLKGGKTLSLEAAEKLKKIQNAMDEDLGGDDEDGYGGYNDYNNAGPESVGAGQNYGRKKYKDEAIVLGDKLQDNTHASLQRTLKMTVEAEQMGTNALSEMHRQEEQIGRLHEDMEDISLNLNRAKKIVRQLASGAASDRCIQILCAFITLAILVCVVLAAVGMDQGQLNVPDEVRDD